MIADPSQPHSETSQDAARRIVPSVVTQRARVLECLRAAANGMTDEEMQVALQMNQNSQRPRRIELVDARLVYDSGRTRPTASGREAVVWGAAAIQGEMF